MAPKLCDPGFLVGSSSSRSFLDVLANSSPGNDFPKLRVSSFRGLPSLWISELEIQALAIPFQFSLVCFFPSKRPSLDSIRRFFFNLKLNGEFLVTLLDSSHILIKLANDLDYCSKPPKIDSAISIGTRPSVACVLVELDITKSYPDKVWLGLEKSGYVQTVVMEEFPPFCASYNYIGHVVSSCRPQVDLFIPIKDSCKVSNNHALINYSPPLSVPSASPMILQVTEELGVVNDQVVMDLALNSANVVIEDLDVGCTASALAPEVLVVENVAGLGNVYVGSFNVANSAVGNRGGGGGGGGWAPALGMVAAGDNASVEVLVEPLLVNCIVDHLASPLAGAIVSIEPEVAAPSSKTLDPCVELPISVQSSSPSPIHLEGKTDIVNIPISVMSNAELKSRMAWSMNNSVLVQSNWLDIDDPNSTPSTTDSEDFGAHVNDNMYSFMVGCIVDQAVLNGGEKKKGKVNPKRNNCWFSHGLSMRWTMLVVGNDEVALYTGIVGNLGRLPLFGWLSPMDGPSLAASVW
ncbi:hypothetical protein M5K25_007553 [Dendrobium thyrsiflorum]|uniref:Uncharacterized protein n=1 Tax=Dendrobium thyrsiflorum TaxID=117978 RepID=A0ABD0VEF5_DENTH